MSTRNPNFGTLDSKSYWVDNLVLVVLGLMAAGVVAFFSWNETSQEPKVVTPILPNVTPAPPKKIPGPCPDG